MARMSIRSWFRKQGKQADADAVKRAQEEGVESSAERSRGDRMGQGADNFVSGRIGERPDDIGRLGDYNP